MLRALLHLMTTQRLKKPPSMDRWENLSLKVCSVVQTTMLAMGLTGTSSPRHSVERSPGLPSHQLISMSWNSGSLAEINMDHSETAKCSGDSIKSSPFTAYECFATLLN